MKRLSVLILVAAALAGCTNKDDRITFDGQFFRAKADAVDKADRASFTVSVSPVSASAAGAREAGAYEATAYCIANYGTSRIVWTTGPDADPLAVDRDIATFAGRCRP